jgi:hypothetical protein
MIMKRNDAHKIILPLFWDVEGVFLIRKKKIPVTNPIPINGGKNLAIITAGKIGSHRPSGAHGLLVKRSIQSRKGNKSTAMLRISPTVEDFFI